MGLCSVHAWTELLPPPPPRHAHSCLHLLCFNGGPRRGTGFLEVTKKLLPEKQRVLTSWWLYLFISGHEW